MAAGLPVVVSDWDGYKDTVRDGIDGFSVPTLAAPPGTGRILALRHALEADIYDLYIGQSSLAVAVDVDATTVALDQLAASPELRHRMGAHGAERARSVFDWRVIVRSYESLWEQLGELRISSQASSPSTAPEGNHWPARPDPFDLFACFPTSQLSPRHLVRHAPGIDEATVLSTLSLRVAYPSALAELAPVRLVALWQQVGPDRQQVEQVLSTCPSHFYAASLRALLRLAKFGLIQIDRPEH